MTECVLSDSIIEFTIYKSPRVYPEMLRRVVYLDKETDVTYTYLTNDLTSSALVIANLYKNRWRVELFFYDKLIIMQSQGMRMILTC